MKLITLTLIILPFFAQSQIGAGISGGWSSKQSAIFEMYIVKPVTKKLMFYPVSFKVHSKMSNPNLPVIIEPRLGYKSASWELFTGYGYHFIGNENRKDLDRYKGWKPGAGIIKHLGRFIAATEVSGNVISFQVGVFGIK